MKCPACGAALAAGAGECVSCGVIVAKLAEKRAKELREAAALLERAPAAAAAAPKLGARRLIALALVAAWVVGFSFYYAVALRRARAALLNSEPASQAR